MCNAKRHVRYTPESDHKSGHGNHAMPAFVLGSPPLRVCNCYLLTCLRQLLIELATAHSRNQRIDNRRQFIE
jgi:hypothetical protein